MKEASGEANMTVIVVVLIGVIAAVGIPLVLHVIRRARFFSCCHEIGGYVAQCPGSDSRNNRCCMWRDDETDPVAFSSAYHSCLDEYDN